MKLVKFALLSVMIIFAGTNCATVIARELPMKGETMEVVIDSLSMGSSQYNVGQWRYTPRNNTDDFVIAEVTIRNVTTGILLLDPSVFEIVGPAGETAHPTLIFRAGLLGQREEQRKKDPISSGESVRRILIFAFPKEVRPAKIKHPEMGEVVIPLEVKQAPQPGDDA